MDRNQTLRCEPHYFTQSWYMSRSQAPQGEVFLPPLTCFSLFDDTFRIWKGSVFLVRYSAIVPSTTEGFSWEVAKEQCARRWQSWSLLSELKAICSRGHLFNKAINDNLGTYHVEFVRISPENYVIIRCSAIPSDSFILEYKMMAPSGYWVKELRGEWCTTFPELVEEVSTLLNPWPCWHITVLFLVVSFTILLRKQFSTHSKTW